MNESFILEANSRGLCNCWLSVGVCCCEQGSDSKAHVAFHSYLEIISGFGRYILFPESHELYTQVMLKQKALQLSILA